MIFDCAAVFHRASRPGRRVLLTLLAGALCCAGVAAERESDLAQRVDQLACGGTLVTARASCYGSTSLCANETLTFHRPEGRTILSAHYHRARYPLAGGRRVEALDHHASAWACVAGTNGGRYLAVIMARTADAGCPQCEYTLLYHPNGRLIAATLTFDAAGHSREDPEAAAVIETMVGRPAPREFRSIYGR